MTRFFIFTAACLFLFGGGFSAVPAAENSGIPPITPKTEIYKTIGDVQLALHVFFPPDHKSTDRRPAIVFFFGGGWNSGTPGQFLHQSEYLASRGMVALTADYRVRSRHGTPASACTSDAKSAIRWVRKNAERLGVDPDRVVAAGGSAGGHLAACTGLIEGFDEPAEDAGISSRPNAMILFNPALILAPVPGAADLTPARLAELATRLGTAPEKLSPYHHIRANTPPTLVFVGTADTTTPLSADQAFARKMRDMNNRCELLAYEGETHGFFNYGRKNNEHFQSTLHQTDRFLISLGYLTGTPLVADPIAAKAE